jgi:hypothetical protein
MPSSLAPHDARKIAFVSVHLCRGWPFNAPCDAPPLRILWMFQFVRYSRAHRPVFSTEIEKSPCQNFAATATDAQLGPMGLQNADGSKNGIGQV